jgi:hypothetical protein
MQLQELAKICRPKTKTGREFQIFNKMCRYSNNDICFRKTVIVINEVSIYRVSKKNVTEIQQAVVHHKLNKTIQFLHRTKELLFSFSMIYFLNRNDEKWPRTRPIKSFGRNHILPPLGIENTLIMQS